MGLLNEVLLKRLLSLLEDIKHMLQLEGVEFLDLTDKLVDAESPHVVREKLVWIATRLLKDAHGQSYL